MFKVLKASALCCGFFAWIGLQSCREKSSGYTDLVPGVDNINTFELTTSDLEPKLYARIFDSVVTGDSTQAIGALGVLNGDPFYGDITSGLYLQFTVPAVGYTLPDSIASFDSLVLVIPYGARAYGDTAGSLALNIFEINDPSFKVDTSEKKYYAFSTVPTHPTPVASYAGKPLDWQADTVEYPGVGDVTNQLRIPLSSELLSKFASLTPSNLYNNTSFVQFFNGLYLEPDASLGPEYAKALFYFVLAGPNSGNLDNARLELYFTKEGSSSTQGIITFPFNAKYSAFFNHMTRNDVGRPAAAYHDASVAIDSFLLTGLPGFQTDIVIDNLDQIPANSMIHLARLEMNMKKESFDLYFAHPTLIIASVVNEDGSSTTLADYQITPGGREEVQVDQARQFVGGVPVAKIIDGVEYFTYTLNFPRQVQKHIFDGKKKLTLRLYPYYSLPGAYRFIAVGFGVPDNSRAKINIVYTKP